MNSVGCVRSGGGSRQAAWGVLIVAALQIVHPSCTSGPSFMPATFVERAFDTCASSAWEEGRSYGDWIAVYRGGGDVGIETDTTDGASTQVLFERPAPPNDQDTTHACLVTSRFEAGDFELSVNVKTLRQLRHPMGQAWEGAWVLWHYVDKAHFYYAVLKTNGWELGKADPAVPGGQRFLKTGATPIMVIGGVAEFRIRQQGSTMTLSFGGAAVATVTDTARPLLGGKFGFYTEDAEVRFWHFQAAFSPATKIPADGT